MTGERAGRACIDAAIEAGESAGAGLRPGPDAGATSREEGFGGDTPALHPGPRAHARLRDCRFRVAIRLRTAGWSVAEAARSFVGQGGIPLPLVRRPMLPGDPAPDL